MQYLLIFNGFGYDVIRKYLEKLKFFKKIPALIMKIFDVRDFFVFGGLGMLGYGLWLLKPWIAFTVCGVVFMAIGLFTGRSSAK